MSAFLINKIKHPINDELINLVSRAIHSSDNQTQTAINHAIPDFLTSFLDVIANKLGAESLFQSVTTQDDSILEHLNDQLIEDNHKSFANSGTFSLNSLFGMRKIESLVNHVSSHSGLSHGASSTLLGIIMPIVLSVIKRELENDNKLNTSNLIHLLNKQKESILESIPLAYSTENDDDLMTPAILAKQTKGTVETSKPVKSAISRKLLALLFFSIILFLANQVYLYLSTKPMNLPKLEPIQTTLDTGKLELTAAEKESLEELSAILDAVINTLSEITNTQTAEIKLADLTQHTKDFDNLSKKMTASAKSEAAILVQSKVPQMQVYYDRIKRIPAGQIIIEPVINNLMTKLADTFI